jgi:putative ABC transport system ATP-binding protein
VTVVAAGASREKAENRQIVSHFGAARSEFRLFAGGNIYEMVARPQQAYVRTVSAVSAPPAIPGSLELRDVTKHYASGGEIVRAVDGVSLVVPAGEFAALYGPSGSGKTTLLLLAAALMTPDHGRVLFDGQDVSRLSERESARYRREDVGFVFQAFHLMSGASALDNAALKLIGEGLSLAAARRVARPWLERVGLGQRADHDPPRLSMGERQRVAVARALVNEPRLLLADEPTGNLDSSRSREVLGLLRGICHERGIPGLLVTHDSQAAAFVDRVYTLHDGHLAAGHDRDSLWEAGDESSSCR